MPLFRLGASVMLGLLLTAAVSAPADDDVRLFYGPPPADEQNEAIVSALLDRLNDPDEAVKSEAVAALAYRKTPAAVLVVRHLAPTGSLEFAWTCLEALAYLGVPPTEVFPLSPSFTQVQTMRYARACLVAGYELTAQGKTSEAARVFEGLTDLRTPRIVARPALEELAKLGSAELVTLCLSYLDDIALHETAERALVEAAGTDVEDKLVRAYRVVPPAKRAGILRVLAKRETETAGSLAQEARDDKSALVRVAAFAVLGTPPPLEDLVEAAVSGPPWERSEALAGCLEALRAEFGDEAEAVGMLFEALDRLPSPAHLKERVRKEIEALLASGGAPAK